MPLKGWNGKFQAVGNGAWSGQIWHPLMAEPLARGYATASTDTGHEGDGMDASFALGHPEKVTDFGYRAVHEMTVKSKAIIATVLRQRPPVIPIGTDAPQAASRGSRKHRVSRATTTASSPARPANNWTHLMASGVWMAQATHKDPASYIPPSKFRIMHAAVLEACDGLDGVKDGVLDNPRRCRFDPGSLACKDADGPGCLTVPKWKPQDGSTPDRKPTHRRACLSGARARH